MSKDTPSRLAGVTYLREWLETAQCSNESEGSAYCFSFPLFLLFLLEEGTALGSVKGSRASKMQR
jgi:hypothetical protein